MHSGDLELLAQAPPIRLRAAGGCREAGVGRKSLVMALIGMSHPRQLADQLAKLRALTEMASGPDIIGDLSLFRAAGTLPLWGRVVQETSCVAACLPVYTATVREGRIDASELLDIAVEQMDGGVGLLTIHLTPSQDIQRLAQSRMVPCTSRGGGLIIADAESRNWRDGNAYQRILPELIRHARRNGTVLSLGASYRSGNIFDSCDAAQQAEIASQLEMARNITEQGVGVIIESPGHARPRDIKRLAGLLRPGGFPIMPLGPIPTDTAIGMDHVSSAIGATLLGLEGCAHILAAVTREEHTGSIPSVASTLEAVATARVAAHVIDIHLLADEQDDLAIATDRARNRTCILGKETRGCDRCARACPL